MATLLRRFALLALVASTAGCDVAFNAPKATLLVDDDRISFASAAEAASITGGETVLTIRNDSSAERQIVLARLDDATEIPQEILAAKSAEDDPRIIAITHVMAPAAEGTQQFDSARFHIYLAPGEQHVLLDRLGGTHGSLMMTFVPGRASADAAADGNMAAP